MPLKLPIDMKDRRWIIGKECGDVFAMDGDDFDGITLTLEVKNHEEAQEIAMALFGQGGVSHD